MSHDLKPLYLKPYDSECWFNKHHHPLNPVGSLSKGHNVSVKSDKSLFIPNVKNQLKPDVTIKQIMISHFQINFGF